VRLSSTYWQGVVRADRCAYCGGRVGHVDHVTASAAGGDGHWTNLAGLCASCNLEKATESPLFYLLRRVGVRTEPQPREAPKRGRKPPTTATRVCRPVSYVELRAGPVPRPLGELDRELLALVLGSIDTMADQVGTWVEVGRRVTGSSRGLARETLPALVAVGAAG
jgi:hypothetical protein